jgi:hypothetical protein
MSCKPVDVVVPRGRYDTKVIQMKCGETNHHGMRVTCDPCLNSKESMQEIARQKANMDADNAWNRSAGWGEM